MFPSILLILKPSKPSGIIPELTQYLLRFCIFYYSWKVRIIFQNINSSNFITFSWNNEAKICILSQMYMEKEKNVLSFIETPEKKIRPEWNLADVWNNSFVLLVIIVLKTEKMLFLLYTKSKIHIAFINSAKFLEAVAL